MSDIQAFRVNWTLNAFGEGERRDGFSLHKTPDAVAAYMKVTMDGMPKDVPPEFSFPGEGFRQPLAAVPVVIAADSRLGRKFKDADSIRVFPALDENGELCREARDLKPVGTPVIVEYSHLRVGPDQAAAIAGARNRAYGRAAATHAQSPEN